MHLYLYIMLSLLRFLDTCAFVYMFYFLVQRYTTTVANSAKMP